MELITRRVAATNKEEINTEVAEVYGDHHVGGRSDVCLFPRATIVSGATRGAFGRTVCSSWPCCVP